MNRPKLLTLLRQDWWLLAIVVCILWAIECVIEGNTLFEMLMGQAMVAVWVTAIFLIDQWVFRASRRRG
jgi:hypothetical protein